MGFKGGRVGDDEVGVVTCKQFPYLPSSIFSLPCFHLRVFYVRISGLRVDGSTPQSLTLLYLPLSPDSVLEVNGTRSGSRCSELGLSSLLRRHRVDGKSEEATFVSTDNTRIAGSAKFQVFDRNVLLLSGVLEMRDRHGVAGDEESEKNGGKRWSMDCELESSEGAGTRHLCKGRHAAEAEPTFEVFVAGCFAGTPLVLTKILRRGLHKNMHDGKAALGVIPEHDAIPVCSALQSHTAYESYKQEQEKEEDDYTKWVWRTRYIESEDGELSWFNFGVRVGVGIGLGVCIGIGVGAGLLLRTYKAAKQNLVARYK